MRTLEKINLDKFKAVSLNDAQNESIMGGTHIKTGETGGTDSNTAVATGFPIREDGSLSSDPVIIDDRDWTP